MSPHTHSYSYTHTHTLALSHTHIHTHTHTYICTYMQTIRSFEGEVGEKSFKFLQMRCRQPLRHTRHVPYCTYTLPFFLYFISIRTGYDHCIHIIIVFFPCCCCFTSHLSSIRYSIFFFSSLPFTSPHFFFSLPFPNYHTDWEPSNLLFLETACSLYHLLIEDENTKNLVFNDLKSTVFHDVSRELEHIFEATKGGSWSSSISKCAFRPSNCANTMMREYFILLGRISSSPAGKQILEGTLSYLCLVYSLY